MPFVEILILAVVQGLTEFLPVSSSGHLVVANALLESLGQPKPQDLVEVNIVLHVGTLLAVLGFYRREVLRMFREDRRVIPLIVVATLPVVLVGLPIKAFANDWLESPLLAGMMFPVTAAILIWGAKRQEGEMSYAELSYGRAFGVGVMQAFALLPGISRSGSTIAGGLAAGLTREAAGTFAFLMAIPAIGGPGAIEVAKLLRDASQSEASTGGTPPFLLLVGAVVSFAVGWAALALLIRFIRQGQLALFAWYLVPLGAAVVAWRLLV